MGVTADLLRRSIADARSRPGPRGGVLYGAVLSGRPLAATILAWSLVKVLWDRAFGRKTGVALFHENYRADRLPALSATERVEMLSFSRCTACGICDAGEGERIAASRGAYPGLMALVLSATRSMPDYDAASAALEHVPESVLRQKEAICPARVPFVRLARFVRQKATYAEPAPETGEPRRVAMAPRGEGA